ncbi:MAG: hypothetical protein PHY95_02560 [Candidatus ainarchaeum sp.]|nr:hypothetical protein [Candidatus ainarchaeum sp.]
MITTATATCDGSLIGNINIISKDGTADSNYQDYTLREGDVFFIRNFSISNDGNCTLERLRIRILLEKPSGEIFDFCVQRIIQKLEPNQTYSVYPETEWEKLKNVLACGATLDEIGTYKLHYAIEFNDMQTVGYGLSINNEWRDPMFSVHSRAELEGLETIKAALGEARIANYIAIMGILLSIALMLKNSIRNVYFWVTDRVNNFLLSKDGYDIYTEGLMVGESINIGNLRLMLSDVKRKDSFTGNEIRLDLYDQDSKRISKIEMKRGMKKIKLHDNNILIIRIFENGDGNNMFEKNVDIGVLTNISSNVSAEAKTEDEMRFLIERQKFNLELLTRDREYYGNISVTKTIGFAAIAAASAIGAYNTSGDTSIFLWIVSLIVIVATVLMMYSTQTDFNKMDKKIGEGRKRIDELYDEIEKVLRTTKPKQK